MVKADSVPGDLGGVPVRIPLEFAEQVEYDNDPGIMEPRLTKVPVRNSSSKLRSFGFEFRYPDMSGPGTDEARKDKAASLPGNTQWVFVGLNAGQRYYGAGGIDRLAAALLAKPDFATKEPYRFAKEKTCGLETYFPDGTGADGIPNRANPDSEDLFVDRDSAGKVKTLIRCRNSQHRASPCKHHFDLEPNMHVDVYLGYRRGRLCEWHGIQSATSQIISGFRVNGDASSYAVPAASIPIRGRGD